MDLVVIEEIKRLKYRYLRHLDLKQWDDFGSLFTDDATASYGADLSFSSREEIVAFMRASLGPDMITSHQCHHPEIEVGADGTTATGSWNLADVVIMTEHRLLLTGAAFYSDRYVRADDGWRIAHTGYVRTFEAMQSFDDTPSFKLTANRWATS
ncbi:MAG: Bile acid 7-alpha dehydratase [Acidimicrobiales bacterium]|nr:Bile acid 7-alpha dehydratase [Acidimicrobiales bacterium]